MGAIEEFEVRLDGEDALLKSLTKDAEVGLFWSSEAQACYVRLPASPAAHAIVGVNDSITAKLGELLRHNLPRISWIIMVNHANRSFVIQVNSFPKQVELPQLDFCVDEKIVLGSQKNDGDASS